MNKLKIHVIGCGVVGGTLAKWLEENTEHEITKQDPMLGYYESANKETDAVFIAVPVPTEENPEDGQDLSILRKVISFLQVSDKCEIFIKSTVLPGTCDRLADFFKLKIYSMPEFLTERQADADFKNQDTIITATPNIDLVNKIFPGKKYAVLMFNKECEMAKYAHNVFGAMKVTYANIIYKLATESGCNYEAIVYGLLQSRLIGSKHWQVPGPDGKLGFGGACFPKDLKAFKSLFDIGSKTHMFFESIEKINKMVRDDNEGGKPNGKLTT